MIPGDRAAVDGTEIVIPAAYSYVQKELKSLGARWDAKRGAWTLPATRMNAEALNDTGMLPERLSVDPAPAGADVDDTRLYGFQRAAAARLAASPHGQILVAKPGLGKTAMAIAAADLSVPDDTIIVVAPASLLRTWEREIARWGRVPGPVHVVQGKMDFIAAGNARWIIVSWDKFAREWRSFGKGWPLLILDESVLAKSRRSKRFQSLDKFRRCVARVWLLSGSPTTRYADDLWAQLHLVWPRAFRSYWRFAERYTVVEDTPWSRVVSGDRSGRDAAADNADLVIVITEEDAGLDLPEYLFEPALEVELEGAQARAYADMERDFVASLESGDAVVADNEIGRLMKLQQIASYFDGRSAKRDALVDVIRSYEPPYLVWTHWRETASDLFLHLAAAGVDTRFVTGETPDRDAIIEGYKAGDFECLILSLGVGKFGHTLVNTRTIFGFDRNFNGDDYFQSMHRTRRIGLKHRPVVVPIVASRTVDELTVGDNLEAKMRSISRMTKSNLADLLKGLGR